MLCKRVAQACKKLQYPRVFAFLHRIFTPPAPEPPRLSARVTTLENLADDFDSRIAYLASELKKVRGRQYASEKRAQDDVQEANDERPVPDDGPPRAYPSTAHLARRLRGF